MSGAARQTMYARRYGAPWRPDEDLAVRGAEPGQLRAVAVQLGRTHTAVVRRRGELMRKQSTKAIRFQTIRAAGEWTIWDSKDGRRIKPAAKWDAHAADEIAKSLNARPFHADEWEWVPYWPI